MAEARSQSQLTNSWFIRDLLLNGKLGNNHFSIFNRQLYNNRINKSKGRKKIERNRPNRLTGHWELSQFAQCPVRACFPCMLNKILERKKYMSGKTTAMECYCDPCMFLSVSRKLMSLVIFCFRPVVHTVSIGISDKSSPHSHHRVPAASLNSCGKDSLQTIGSEVYFSLTFGLAGKTQSFFWHLLNRQHSRVTLKSLSSCSLQRV